MNTKELYTTIIRLSVYYIIEKEFPVSMRSGKVKRRSKVYIDRRVTASLRMSATQVYTKPNAYLC